MTLRQDKITAGGIKLVRVEVYVEKESTESSTEDVQIEDQVNINFISSRTTGRALNDKIIVYDDGDLSSLSHQGETAKINMVK